MDLEIGNKVVGEGNGIVRRHEAVPQGVYA
jgi:hypothetical protein